MSEKEQRGENKITDEFKQHIGKLIRKKRVELNWTQNILATKVQTNTETIRRWESGISFPSPMYRRRLIKVLKLRRDLFIPLKEQSKQGDREDTGVIHPPVTRKYKGWRTGEYMKFTPGEWPHYDYYEENRGAGKTHVTVNGYPLQLFHLYTDVGYYKNLYDWGYIGRATEHLAVSLLADYFGETSIPGRESTAETYQAVRYCFQFYVEVVLYLPYEEWELSSDEITKWLERERVRRKREEQKTRLASSGEDVAEKGAGGGS